MAQAQLSKLNGYKARLQELQRASRIHLDNLPIDVSSVLFSSPPPHGGSSLSPSHPSPEEQLAPILRELEETVKERRQAIDEAVSAANNNQRDADPILSSLPAPHHSQNATPLDQSVATLLAAEREQTQHLLGQIRELSAEASQAAQLRVELATAEAKVGMHSDQIRQLAMEASDHRTQAEEAQIRLVAGAVAVEQASKDAAEMRSRAGAFEQAAKAAAQELERVKQQLRAEESAREQREQGWRNEHQQVKTHNAHLSMLARKGALKIIATVLGADNLPRCFAQFKSQWFAHTRMTLRIARCGGALKSAMVKALRPGATSAFSSWRHNTDLHRREMTNGMRLLLGCLRSAMGLLGSGEIRSYVWKWKLNSVLGLLRVKLGVAQRFRSALQCWRATRLVQLVSYWSIIYHFWHNICSLFGS